MPIKMDTLSIENFSYYAFNPRSPALSKQDQKIAIVATALLALTLGLGHIVCAIIYAACKNDFEAGLTLPTALRTIENTFLPRNTLHNNPNIFSESNIRNFDRNARNISNPHLRNAAFKGVDFCRDINQLGQGNRDRNNIISERDIRSYERDARNISDPLLRDVALVGADLGRGVNQLGQTFAKYF